MTSNIILVAESLDGSKVPAAPAGMIHYALADDWHRTLCGRDVPYQILGLTMQEALGSGTNAYPCGPCGRALRSATED